MLYDQGQLMKSYADAYLVTKDNYFAEIVDDIATYVIRDLRHKVLYLLCFQNYMYINIYLFYVFLGRWVL